MVIWVIKTFFVQFFCMYLPQGLGNSQLLLIPPVSFLKVSSCNLPAQRVRGSLLQQSLASLRGPVFYLDCLSRVILAFSEYLQSSQHWCSSWKPEHPAPTRSSGHECKPLLSWEVLFGNELCGEFSLFCLWPPVALFPSEVPKLPFVLTREGFLNMLELFLLHSPSPGCWSLSPNPFFFFLNLYLLPTSFWDDWLAFLEVKDLLPAFRMYSVWVDPHTDVFFDVFVGRKLIFLFCSSTILKVPPPLSCKIRALRINLDLFSLSSIFSQIPLISSHCLSTRSQCHHSGRSTASSNGSVSLKS